MKKMTKENELEIGEIYSIKMHIFNADVVIIVKAVGRSTEVYPCPTECIVLMSNATNIFRINEFLYLSKFHFEVWDFEKFEFNEENNES